MARSALEIADIFRDHGGAWRRANRGHVSHAQLKVMNAIEGCRTAALGGHVARCANPACDHTAIASHDGFSAVILAVPAPQAIPLLASVAIAIPQLETTRFAPCWSLMLALDTTHEVPFVQLRPDDDVISWIARDCAKPSRGGQFQTFVVHAKPAWSRRYLEQSPDEAMAALLERFRALTGLVGQPTYAAAHRWRFALVEQAAGVSCLWNPESAIGACGDWCLGPRIEAAYDSGNAMARAVLQSKGAKRES